MEELPECMNSPEHLQLIVIHGLKSDADPVDAARFPYLCFFLSNRPGIDFHRNLAAAIDLKMFSQRTKNPGGVSPFQHRRGPTAQKYGFYTIFFIVFPAQCDLPDQGIHICRPLSRVRGT